MKKFLLFLIFFLPFQFALNPTQGIDLSIARLLIVLAFFVWFISSLLKKKILIKNNYITWGLLLFLVLALFSIIKAEEVSWALRKLLVFVSIFPLYFLITQYFNKKDFEKISKTILTSSTIIALLGVFQFLSQFLWDKMTVFNFWSKYLARFFLGEAFAQSVITNPSWWVNIGGRTLLRATSLFPDPHMLSFFLGMTLPLVIPFLFKKKASLRHYTIYTIVTLINLTALVLTFSRGGYLGLIASGLILFFLLFKYLNQRQKLLIVLASLLLIIAVVAIGPVRSRLLSSFDFSEGSVSGRLEIWNQSLSVWLKNFWLGVGIGNYSYYLSPLHSYRAPIYAHNTYLDIGVEMGILALLAWFSIFIYAIYKLSTLNIRHSVSSIQKMCIISSLVYFSTHALFDTPIYSPRILPILMVIYALASILINKKRAS